MGFLDFMGGRRTPLESLALIAMSHKSVSVAEMYAQDWSGNSNKIRNSSDELNVYSGALPWVSVAVDSITRDVASQECFFSDMSGKTIELRNVPDAIKTPFELGWKGLSFVDMLKFIIPSKLLAGQGYLWNTVGTLYGKSFGLKDVFIPLTASQVKIVLKQNGLGIGGYCVKLGDGQQFMVPPEDMIHIRQNAIISPFVGVGNISKMRLTAEGEISAAEYINSFLADSKGMPLTIFLDKTPMQDSDKARMAQMLKSKWSPKILYMNVEDSEVIQSSLMQKDMQFLELRGYDRQTTLSVFGVPLSEAGIPDANFASANAARIKYLSSTINPTLREVADSITRQFVWQHDRRIKFNFRLHSSGDIDNVGKSIQYGLITPNRGAELIGEEFDLKDETRNTYYMPSTYIPLGYLPPEPTEQAQEAPAPGKMLDPEKKKEILSNPKNVELICSEFVKSATRPKHFQVRYLRASLKSRNAIEEKFTGRLAEFFADQQKRVMSSISVKSLDTKGVMIDFNLDEENEALLEVAKGMHTSGVQRAIGDINAILDERVNLNLSNPFVLAQVRKLGTKITGNVNKTTLDDMQRIITKAVDESWNINEIQDAVSGKFDQYQGYRARMIARTESRAAWDAGAKVAYQEIGVKTVDIVGCTEFEADSDCGKQNINVASIDTLTFHPNHVGCPAPSKE